MKYLLATLLTVSVSLFAETVKVHVPEMVCQMCVQGMKREFGGVVKSSEKDIKVNLDTKMVTVTTLKPISDADIKRRVKKAGYDVKQIMRIK